MLKMPLDSEIFTVISDIHGNHKALEKILMQGAGKKNIIFLGDVLGYFPFAQEAVDMLLKQNLFVCLAGNHEMDLRKGQKLIKQGNVAQYLNLDTAAQKFIDKLPEDAAVENLHMQLGFKHYFPGNVQKFRDNSSKPAVIFQGHTHSPTIDTHEDIISINPGSVGHQRFFDPRAAYCEASLEKKDFKIRKQPYDYDIFARLCEEKSIHYTLVNRIFFGCYFDLAKLEYFSEANSRQVNNLLSYLGNVYRFLEGERVVNIYSHKNDMVIGHLFCANIGGVKRLHFLFPFGYEEFILKMCLKENYKVLPYKSNYMLITGFNDGIKILEMTNLDGMIKYE